MDKKAKQLLVILTMNISIFCLMGCQEGSSRNNAIDLPLNTIVEGVLKAGTVIYYKFNVETEKLYEFKIQESISIRMTILDSEGTVVDFSEDDDKMYWDSVTFDVAGVYYLRLDASQHYQIEYPVYSDEETAAYKLMLTEKYTIHSFPDELTIELAQGEVMQDQILDFFSPRHFYKIQVPATVDGNVINYVIASTHSSYVHPIYVSLYDANRHYYYAGPNFLSLKISSAESAATYYVVVQFSNNDYDEYTKTNYLITFDVKPQIQVTPTSKSLDANGGSFSVDISNAGGAYIGGWCAYIQPSFSSWLAVREPSCGGDSGTIIVEYAANTGCNPREGYVNIDSNEGGYTTVSVTQEAGCSSSQY